MWTAPTLRGRLAATCPLPGSKSESNRALVLSALADGPSSLTGVLRARDTDLMVEALRALGVGIEDRRGDSGERVTRVHPPERFHAPGEPIHCGLAGNVMRFVPPLAALAPGETRFVADERASERPMGPLLDGLAQLGANSDARRLPFTLEAPEQLGGPQVVIDSTASSQFISALLLAAARFPMGIDLRHLGGPVPSTPHIAMTVAMLRDRGVLIDDDLPNARWRVCPGTIAARDQRIEPDLTNAAVFLAAGVLSGGSVRVPGWPTRTQQPGDRIRDVLAAMGARTVLHGDMLTATATGTLAGAEFDLHHASELTPTVSALAAFASGRTTITGVAHIRGHETDRIAAIVAELTSVGVAAHELPDGLVIEGAAGRIHQLAPTRLLRSYADHRLAHLGALLGLRIPGIEVDDIATVAKTMPDFTDRWAGMVAQTERAPH